MAGQQAVSSELVPPHTYYRCDAPTTLLMNRLPYIYTVIVSAATFPYRASLPFSRSRRDFYRRAGFVEVEPRQFPRWIWLEAALGTVMARLAVGEQLVVMCRAAGQ